MFHKVQKVSAKEDATLVVVFTCGQQKQFDMKPLIAQFPPFQALQEVPGLFAQVQVDTGGYAIHWNDQLDICSNDLWENGTPITDDKIA